MAKRNESQAFGKGVNDLNTSSSFPSSQALTPKINLSA